MEKIKKSHLKKCDCGEILWEWIDGDTVKIFGPKGGKDYEIGFNYIFLVCGKCGKRIYERSEVAKVIETLLEKSTDTINYLFAKSLKLRPYAIISMREREEITKNLSQKQKEVFYLLTNGDEEFGISRIAEITGLNKNIVVSHINKINEEIEKVVPDFRVMKTKLDIVPRKDKIK